MRAYWRAQHVRRREQERAYRRSPRTKVLQKGYAHRRRALVMRAPLTPFDPADVIARDASTCYLCGRVLAPQEISLDHVVPLVRGGAHAAENVRVACLSGNKRKQQRRPEELPPDFRCTE
jgi:5-methylcytosine-specific restriction endonuclease McrA